MTIVSTVTSMNTFIFHTARNWSQASWIGHWTIWRILARLPARGAAAAVVAAASALVTDGSAAGASVLACGGGSVSAVSMFATASVAEGGTVAGDWASGSARRTFPSRVGSVMSPAGSAAASPYRLPEVSPSAAVVSGSSWAAGLAWDENENGRLVVEPPDSEYGFSALAADFSCPGRSMSGNSGAWPAASAARHATRKAMPIGPRNGRIM